MSDSKKHISDSKKHIIDVSFGLFLQKSFKEVTMQEIVAKTGMSKGAFYHYFESKEQLFLEVINHFTSSI
ncbi:MAG: TetR/AcrR family transcriptional regulator, partial [Bacillota bacterium]